MTQHTRPTVAAFKRYARTELTPLVHAMLAARLFAASERSRVDAYTAPIFAEYDFRPKPEWIGEFGRGSIRDEPLTQENLYLTDMDAPAYQEYNRRVLAANVENGWRGHPDYCPALAARSAEVESEHAVLVSLGCFMGADFTRTYGENREQALALAVSSCLAD